MAVPLESQNRGIGNWLVREGLERAKSLGHTSVIVLGYPTYYLRFGFQLASKWRIRAPFEAPEESFMALELIPGALEGGGVVEYVEAY